MKVGFEIHVYPRTRSKLFCMCPVEEAPPNTNICPVCTGQPGAKPMEPNDAAVEKALLLAKALRCGETGSANFLRKHYFYPDLPSGYQRTSTPFGEDGEFLGVGIREVHLEEDAGRYDPRLGTVDFNRAGTPLIEIVTDPEVTSVSEAREFLREFAALLNYLELLRPGSTIKADTNVSVGDTRVEVKNINTVHGIINAIEHEVSRQERLLDSGTGVVRETRHYDEAKGKTVAARLKEEEADYRYMRDPDLQPLDLSFPEEMPEGMMDARRRLEEHGLDDETSRALTEEQGVLALYDSLSADFDRGDVAEWLKRDLRGELNYRSTTLRESPVDAEAVEELARRYLSGDMTAHKTREILRDLLDGELDDIPEEKGVSDEELSEAVQDVLDANPGAVEKYESGDDSVFNFLLGEVNEALDLRAEPKEIAKALKEELG